MGLLDGLPQDKND
jgi:hypothetical protein